jgi:hypothetical protein
MLVDTFGFGRIIHDGFMFRQNFSIRSYEIGADRTASIETLMNHLQVTCPLLNSFFRHLRSTRLFCSGSGPLLTVFLSFLVLFQETALNHVKGAGLLGDGFGSTPEMSKRNLFWVVSQMQAIVERYPCWYIPQTCFFFSFVLLYYLSLNISMLLLLTLCVHSSVQTNSFWAWIHYKKSSRYVCIVDSSY